MSLNEEGKKSFPLKITYRDLTENIFDGLSTQLHLSIHLELPNCWLTKTNCNALETCSSLSNIPLLHWSSQCYSSSSQHPIWFTLRSICMDNLNNLEKVEEVSPLPRSIMPKKMLILTMTASISKNKNS